MGDHPTIEASNGTVVAVDAACCDLHLRAEGPAPVTLRVPLDAHEHLVGLGERFGRMDLTGTSRVGAIQPWVGYGPEDTYVYVPLVISSAGYGLLLDTSVQARWDLGATDPWTWTVTVPASSVDVHVFHGPPRDVVSRSSGLTGRPQVPPRWTMGVWKTTLSGTGSVLRELERMRTEDLPVTAAWVYDHYHEETNSGCGLAGTYPQGEYPDLSALTRGIHDHGLRALGYVQPGLFTTSRPFEHAASRGWLVQRQDGSPYTIDFFNPKTARAWGHVGQRPDQAAYLDLSNPEAADWYVELLDEVCAQGWDGWMQDMGEHLLDDMVLHGGDGAELRNEFATIYHRTCHRAWSRDSDRAPFVRSAAPGTLPYTPVVWPGDQQCDWAGLRSVVPAGPSAGLAGVGVWGPDIPGLVDSATDHGAAGRDDELYIRWCQYGALTPVMRDHGGFKEWAGNPVDLWSTPRTTATWREYGRLHLRLLPYLERLAAETSQTGIPMIRALLLEFPEETEAWSIDDQYLLGPALLVAPVLERGARTREVWFPPGEWHDWWDETRYEGPRWSTVPAPLERLPLFRRAGHQVEILDDVPNEL